MQDAQKRTYSTKQFAQFEAEHNLFSLTYRGVPYWQLLRFPISERCLYHADGVDTMLPRKAEASRFVKLFFAAMCESVRQLVRLPRVKCADVLFFYTSDERRVGGETVNPFFDCIDPAAAGLTVQRVWDTQDYTHLPAAARCNIAPAVFGGYLRKLWYRFFRAQTRDEAAYRQLCDTVQLVNETFGTAITDEEVRGYENEIFYLMSAHKAFVPYYKRVLRRVKPKAVVVKCYYMVPCLMMIKAARALEIPVVELQHGHIYNHISYCFADKTPQGKLVPDVLFAFNQFFAQECLLTDATRIAVTGYPFLERSLAHYARAPLDRSTVVFYSQPSLGHTLTEFMLAFSKAGAPHGLRVLCKLHPGECAAWREMYPELARAHKANELAVDDDRSANVYAYVAAHRWQVVADSTTAFEVAAVEGTRLFIPLCCPHSNTQPMLDIGFAQAVETPEALLAAVLADGSGQAGSAAQRDDAEPFWPQDAAKLMCEALRDVVNGESFD